VGRERADTKILCPARATPKIFGSIRAGHEFVQLMQISLPPSLSLSLSLSLTHTHTLAFLFFYAFFHILPSLSFFFIRFLLFHSYFSCTYLPLLLFFLPYSSFSFIFFFFKFFLYDSFSFILISSLLLSWLFKQ
jgi:hypothetical protein